MVLTLLVSAWEMYVDRYDERHTETPVRASKRVDMPGQLHASETASRLVAYSSPYIFWLTVIALSAAILLLQ